MIPAGEASRYDSSAATPRRVFARRYIVVETAISVAINTFVTTVPTLLFHTAEGLSNSQSTHAFAVGLTPQIWMGAFMSSLVPSLLTRQRQARGRLNVGPVGAGVSVPKIVATAVALAASFTLIVLFAIHLMIPPLLGDGIGWAVSLCVSGAQGALAGALVTPIALHLLFLRVGPRPSGSPSSMVLSATDA